MSQKNKNLRIGKLPMDLLRQHLKNYTFKDHRVIIGPEIGMDATVIDMGEQYLIAKTDPITFVTDEIGFYAVHINANDIACMGGTPRWFLATLLLPEGHTSQVAVESIFRQISQSCKNLNICYCGGHTEITYNLDRPIVIGQMLGEVTPEKLITSKRTRVGDRVLLTKGIAIETVSIIAREKEAELARLYSHDFIQRCKGFIHSPGISVVEEAKIATSAGEVHGMHDPTEGGLATGLYELAEAANVGLEIDADRIPILPEAKILCDAYHLEVLGCIASGALLITAPAASVPAILSALHINNILAVEIGQVVPREAGIHIFVGTHKRKLPVFEQDEITRLFASHP